MVYKTIIGEKPIVYTKDIHAESMVEIIAQEDPCCCCPCNVAKEDYRCEVCRTFIGIHSAPARCPCHILGLEEAIRRTRIALEEYGYSV